MIRGTFTLIVLATSQVVAWSPVLTGTSNNDFVVNPL